MNIKIQKGQINSNFLLRTKKKNKGLSLLPQILMKLNEDGNLIFMD